MSKHSINLLQADLLPEKPTLTLSRVISIWVLVFIVMVAFSAFTAFQNENSSGKLKLLQSKQKHNQQYLSELETKLKAKQSDPQLTARLDLLKKVILHKKALHEQLTDTNRTYVQGFSLAMSELSHLHHPDISLQKVDITNDDLTFTGLARRPEAVPTWLAGFENSKLLSGKSFVNFKLEESEQHGTEFIVSSIVGNKAL